MNSRHFIGMTAVSLVMAGCASAPSRHVVDGYIADPGQIGFAVYQGTGQVVPVSDGKYLTFNLKNSDFAFSSKYPEIRIYLTEKEVGEFRKSNDGLDINRLSGALSGASSPDAATLFIADFAEEYSPNNALNMEHGLRKVSSGTYRYDVKTMYMMKGDKEVKLSDFSGELFGFAWLDFNGNATMDMDEVSRLKFSFAR